MAARSTITNILPTMHELLSTGGSHEGVTMVRSALQEVLLQRVSSCQAVWHCEALHDGSWPVEATTSVEHRDMSRLRILRYVYIPRQLSALVGKKNVLQAGLLTVLRSLFKASHSLVTRRAVVNHNITIRPKHTQLHQDAVLSDQRNRQPGRPLLRGRRRRRGCSTPRPGLDRPDPPERERQRQSPHPLGQLLRRQHLAKAGRLHCYRWHPGSLRPWRQCL